MVNIQNLHLPQYLVPCPWVGEDWGGGDLKEWSGHGEKKERACSLGKECEESANFGALLVTSCVKDEGLAGPIILVMVISFVSSSMLGQHFSNGGEVDNWPMAVEVYNWPKAV